MCLACCMMSSRYSSLASLESSWAIVICLSTLASHLLEWTRLAARSAENWCTLWYSGSKTSSTG